VEVASFHQNELRAVTTLSPDGERLAAVLAALGAAALVLAAMIVGTVLVNLRRTVVHAPTFLIAWLGVAGTVAAIGARRAADRARRYVVGAALDADAFGSSEVDLVRRGAAGYELTLVPGMTGIIESGRSPLPVESLVASGPARLALPRQGRVWIRLGPATWVLRHVAGSLTGPNLSWAERMARSWASLRRSMPMVAAGMPIAVLATLLGSTPAAMALGDKEMQSLIPAGATPWEIEQKVRLQAQRQVSSLHRCFDPMPLACQRPGFVGVGLSLSKQGEILSHWVSRSTYAGDCPVTDCMADSAAQWFFEPLPEPMRLVLPIQVKRTTKPLHLPGVAISAELPIE
jgi:hypothetical protein